MQAISEDEDKRSSCREADPVDFVICIGGLSRYMEGKYVRGLRRRDFGI